VVPYISFTFDDFPRSALLVGGRILADHGVRGTYFVSLGLLGTPSQSGPIASRDDLQLLTRLGHEVGCHTFDHLDGWNSGPAAFERSIEANRAALAEVVPGARFPVFAYPLDGPSVRVKRAVGRHFVCCRGGGQAFNAGTADLNLLNAYFLDWRNLDDPSAVCDVIRRNSAANGYLVFATHDIADQPSRFGWPPQAFAQVVRCAVESGARVVPMATACSELRFGLVGQ
jgi:peptidoglycan/xylan/chitin deacetylase (PgdA/CDA1 family)